MHILHMYISQYLNLFASKMGISMGAINRHDMNKPSGIHACEVDNVCELRRRDVFRHIFCCGEGQKLQKWFECFHLDIIMNFSTMSLESILATVTDENLNSNYKYYVHVQPK